LRGKLGALPPGPTALLPHTRPGSNGINGLYGHGFYGNGYGNGYGTLETRRKTASKISRILEPIFCRRELPRNSSPIGVMPPNVATILDSTGLLDHPRDSVALAPGSGVWIVTISVRHEIHNSASLQLN